MNNDIIKILNLKETDIETIDSYVDNNILYINLKLSRKVMHCPYCINNKIKIKDYRIQEINHLLHITLISNHFNSLKQNHQLISLWIE